MLIICLDGKISSQENCKNPPGPVPELSSDVASITGVLQPLSARWVPWFTFKCETVRYTLKPVVKRLLRHRLQPWLLNWRNNFRGFDFACSHSTCYNSTTKTKWKNVSERSPNWNVIEGLFCFHSKHKYFKTKPLNSNFFISRGGEPQHRNQFLRGKNKKKLSDEEFFVVSAIHRVELN